MRKNILMIWFCGYCSRLFCAWFYFTFYKSMVNFQDNKMASPDILPNTARQYPFGKIQRIEMQLS